MLTAQDLYIYAIIRKRCFDLLKPEIVNYFSGYNVHLLAAAFMIRMKKGEPTKEMVKNYIYADNELDKQAKSAILKHLSAILEEERYIDVLSLEKAVQKQYYDMTFAKLNNLLNDSNATLEMKKQFINDTANVIKETREVDDFKSIKKLLEDLKVKQPDETVGSMIKLEDMFMKDIFDDTIYPHMYSILAKPNDFKTTLLYNLILELSRLGKPGILISLEDSSTMSAVKFMSLLTGIGKKEIIHKEYNNEIYDSGLTRMKNNIYVMDKMRNADEIYMDLHNKLLTGNFQWIAVDYLQCVKAQKYLSEYEKISNLDWRLFELNKEFKIPVFRLTQAPKGRIQDASVLGMGDEKGSGEISHNSRYSLSINKTDDCYDGETVTRLVNIYKTSFRKHCKVMVEFHGPSGKILSTKEVG